MSCESLDGNEQFSDPAATSSCDKPLSSWLDRVGEMGRVGEAIEEMPEISRLVELQTAAAQELALTLVECI